MAELDFSKQIGHILDAYRTLKEEQVKAVIKEGLDEARAEVTAASPRRSGDYAKSWAVKTSASKGGAKGVVYNKDHYRLTHLLEYGHVIRNKAGGRTYGKTAERPHVAPVQKETIQRILQELEEAFRK